MSTKSIVYFPIPGRRCKPSVSRSQDIWNQNIMDMDIKGYKDAIIGLFKKWHKKGLKGSWKFSFSGGDSAMGISS